MNLPERTLQDLLAERRAYCLELSRETDAMARALITYYISDLDRQVTEHPANITGRCAEHQE